MDSTENTLRNRAEPIPSTSAAASNSANANSASSSPLSVPKPMGEEPEAAASTSATEHHSDSEDGDKKQDDGTFECNICLDTAKDAVVSYCGHLFCWPCLHQWLETRPNRQSCPVCKAALSRDKVVPLYGRGGSNVDPRSKVPPRPTPTRQEQAEGNRFTWGNHEGNGFTMSFGIGAFPFGFVTSALNFGQPGPAGGGVTGGVNVQFEEQEFLSKVFLYVAIVFIVWLLLA